MFARGADDANADGMEFPTYHESTLKKNGKNYFSSLMGFITLFCRKDVLFAWLSDAQDMIAPEPLRQRVKNAYNELKLDEAHPTRGPTPYPSYRRLTSHQGGS